jgi:hypothetical protein
MILSEMVSAINNRCDDVISTQLATEFLNAGQNLLAIEVGAAFQQLNYTDANSTFDFPAKFHEIPIIYACMRFKESDSVLTEASNYRAQFEQMKKYFVQYYELPAYLRDDRLAQQFTPTVAGQTAFVITKDGYDWQQGNLVVYKNGSRMVSWSKVTSTVRDESEIVTTSTTTNDPRGFILTNPCVLTDRITAVWEEHQDVAEPPVPWWKGQGW